MDAVTATPASGIDSSYTDDAVRAQDDLYAHFNGKWLATHEIPADRSIDGSFIVLRDRAEENVRDLIVAAAASHTESGTDECKIGDLYASFMDTSHIEALGIGPISDELAAIDAVTTTADLARRLGRLQRHGVSGLIGFYVDTDAKDSSRYLVHLSQSGLGLPDESYYREDKYAAIREDIMGRQSMVSTMISGRRTFKKSNSKSFTLTDLEDANLFILRGDDICDSFPGLEEVPYISGNYMAAADFSRMPELLCPVPAAV